MPADSGSNLPQDNNAPFQAETGTQRSFGATMIAIFWSFIGLRRNSDFDRDAAGAMNPVYVIVAGLIGTLLGSQPWCTQRRYGDAPR